MTSTMDTWPPYLDDHFEQEDGTDEIATEELENELPKVDKDQFQLSTVVQRLAGDLYGQLLLNAETLGSLPDSNKKAKLMKWIQDSQKQVAKAAVLCKWTRNADDIQKAMNVSAFLRTQAQQFEWAQNAITLMKGRVHQYRVRNPDLLTSLDVLSTGQYTRFPTGHQDEFVPKKPFTKPEIAKAFSQVEDILRVRLKTKDLVPVEMSNYRIEKGRAFFRVPGRFETSLIMTGAHEDDIWAFVSVEFLFNIPNGENKGIKEFPRFPPKAYRDQLAFQVVDIISPPAIPEQPLASAVVDAPLIRVYNFLQLLSMHYLLEVLLYQAGQLARYGWNKRIQLRAARDRKWIRVAYWTRPAQPRTDPGGIGGELIISIVSASSIPGGKPYQTATDRVRMQLQGMAKLKGRVPSDKVEELAFHVQWVPRQATGGAALSTKDTSSEGLAVDPDNLNLEALLMTVIRRHAAAVMSKHWENARSHQYCELFPHSEDLTTVLYGDEPGLRLRLSSHHSVTVALDVRSGGFVLINDATGLDSVARGTKYRDVADRINQNPQRLVEELAQLRNNMIIENIAVKARYLGLTAHTHRILTGAAQTKFGKHHGSVYIQLAKFPQNYLVVLINAQEQNFKYALITLKENDPGMGVFTVMDFAWVDAEKLKGVQNHSPQVPGLGNTLYGVGHAPGLFNSGHTPDPFDIDIGFLRDVHSYCRARVAHMLIELQLKARSIPYTHVLPQAPEHLARQNSNEGDAEIQFNMRSPLAQFVPNLCVQASDMLAGPAAAAAEAAMPNIRIEPINWWTVDKPCQVHTSVMLKYVQPPLRRSEEGGTGCGEGKTIMRPSEKIVYDTAAGVISFWSGEVTECVGEFLAEWERVSKVVVIARQVSTMPKLRGWNDVRLLSFDLQTVEFAYSRDYALSITCSEGSYLFSFWRCDAVSSDNGQAGKEKAQSSPEQWGGTAMDVERTPLAAPPPRRNAHEDSEQFIKGLLKDDHLSASVFDLVCFLRETIGIVEELERIEEEGSDKVEVLVKAAGWYRILYSNSRVFNPGGVSHALDIRLMQEGKVLVIDGSQRIHRSLKGKENEAPDGVAENCGTSHGLLLGTLSPIPKFEQIAGEVVASAGGSGAVGYGKGLVALSDLAPGMVRQIHERVLEAL